jgi:DNA-binding response OmpR family regulator
VAIDWDRVEFVLRDLGWSSAMLKRILIIDDDEKLTKLLSEYLGQFDMLVEAALHPREGLRLFNRFEPDLVILDIMLPDQDGFSVCKQIRQQSSVPIIMLTARGDVTDRVVGLEIGADDYMPKPFEPRELVARIQAVLRRHENPVDELMTSEGLVANTQTREVYLRGVNLNLTGTEFEVLRLLMASAGKVLNRDRVLEHIRGIECDAFNRTVDIAMSRLRKKLGESADQPRFIKTIRNKGYLFIKEVVYGETG